jgi:alkylhydroperoxidase family enzyme
MRTVGAEAAGLPEAAAVERVLEALDGLGGLAKGDREVLRFVTMLTLAPRSMRDGNLQPLRDADFDERAIHDIVQVACCFAFMNRLADALGVTLQPEHYALAETLFGEDSLAEHLRWAQGEDP